MVSSGKWNQSNSSCAHRTSVAYTLSRIVLGGNTISMRHIRLVRHGRETLKLNKMSLQLTLKLNLILKKEQILELTPTWSIKLWYLRPFEIPNFSPYSYEIPNFLIYDLFKYQTLSLMLFLNTNLFRPLRCVKFWYLGPFKMPNPKNKNSANEGY